MLHSSCRALLMPSSASPIVRRIVRLRRPRSVRFRCNRSQSESRKVQCIPYLGVREAMRRISSIGKSRPLVSKDFTRIKGISSGLAFHTPAAALHKADVQILHRESKMIGSYAIEQQAFMEQANVSERSRPEPADLSESEAIRRAQRGDADALARIYQLHCRRVYGLCLRMAGNPTEAEDLTQDAFLTVLRKIQTFRGDSAFSTWLHRITVNLVLMSYRKNALLESSPEKTNKPDGDRGRPHEELGGPDLLLAGSIDRVNLQRAMDQLT